MGCPIGKKGFIAFAALATGAAALALAAWSSPAAVANPGDDGAACSCPDPEPVTAVIAGGAKPMVVPASAPVVFAHDPGRRHGVWLGIVLSGGDSARIRSVADDSPAEEAGLREGDRILEIDGVEIEETWDVIRAMRDRRPGDEARILVERDGEETTLRVTLGERKGRGAPRVEVAPPDREGSVVLIGGARLFLGVELHPMSEELREYFNAPRDTGMLINRIVEDGPAERAGLRAGDVIVAVDGEEVAGVGDIRRALQDREAGDAVPVRVLRRGSEQTIEVTLEERHGRGHGYGYMFLPELHGLEGLEELKAIGHLGDWRRLGGAHRYFLSLSEEERKEFEESMRELRERMLELREQMRDLRLDMREKQRERFEDSRASI